MPTPALSIKALGGILDFFVFVGDSPEHVVQLYTSVVGRPVMPPFWGLGFQLSRYGYKNLTHMQKVINRNINNHVPVVSARNKFCTHSCNMLTTFCLQDVNYLDIDYMVRLVLLLKTVKMYPSKSLHFCTGRVPRLYLRPHALQGPARVHEGDQGEEWLLLGRHVRAVH